MLTAYEGVPINPDLEVTALSDADWRVCRGEIEEHDGRRVLAFIHADDTGYEVMTLAVPREQWRVSCLAAALADLSERLAQNSRRA